MKLPSWLRPRPGAAARDAVLEEAQALLARGEAEAATALLAQALEREPGNAAAARALAFAWHGLGDADQAEYFARRALELDPGAAELQLLLGDVLRAAGRREEALECCRRAVGLAPALAQARNNLGNALKDLGRLEPAIDAFREALERDPAMWEAHYNLAIALQERGAAGEAEAHYRAALARRPQFAQGWLNLGLLQYMKGELDAAMASYDCALEAQPEFAEAHVSRALQRLAAGDFAGGWEEYEWRLRLAYRAEDQVFPGTPRWDGADPAGRTILVYGEQGFGDVLQFFRYAPLLAARGARVLVACHPDLKSLLAGTPGPAAVVSYEDPPPELDLCVPLLSLPRLFGTMLENVPATVPYVFPDKAKARAWAGRLAGARDALKVGLVWASGPKSMRSIALAELAPLAAVPGVAWYGLQRGEAAREADAAPGGLRVTDLTGDLRDFSDNAAVLANLDLVIAADTSIAHLAGAMGMPVWTLHNDPADWRWLLAREDSPWYPSMRLFRARRPGDWPEVVGRVAEALRRDLAARPAPGVGAGHPG